MNGSDRSPRPPQLAIRVMVVGAFALMMFGIIFFRLWFLEVLDSQAYTKQSQNNRIRYIRIPAPRGDIVDRNGNTLVSSAGTYDVEISPPDLPIPAVQSNLANPPIQDRKVYIELSKVLGIPTTRHPCRYLSAVVTSTGANGKAVIHDVYAHPRLSPVACVVAQRVMTQPAYQNVSIQQDVAPDVNYYLAERQNDYPGVEVQQVFRRTYPFGDLAAQLFGTIGRIDKAETTLKRYRGYDPNAVIGQSGLEYEYDKYLRGIDGFQKLQVNALGTFEGNLPGRKPVDGNTLKLSLDKNLQQVGEASLARAVQTNFPGSGPQGGAFVAMNPQNGEIYAMGSNPSFNPTDFTHPMSNAYYTQHYIDATSNYPLFNRAIDGAGPTGSTFKPITAIAALESGALSVGSTIDDTGQFCFPHTTLCLHNAGHVANGTIGLVDAIKVSDDVFFYTLGFRMNVDRPDGGALQHWAHAFGIGRATGVDLPGESAGSLPSPYSLQELYKQELQCENATGPYAGRPKHPRLADGSGGCGIANPGGWTVGDNVNTGIGQGNDRVTPLQLAVVYAALANNGTIVRPHVGLQVDSSDGTVIQSFSPAPLRHLHIDPAYLSAVQQGLRDAASAPGGTSAQVFSNFGQQVYGKTGTAQYNNQSDYAWYACYVPAGATSKPIVVIVTVEQGGFGAVAAAPVARQILSQWFYGNPGPYVAGSSHTL